MVTFSLTIKSALAGEVLAKQEDLELAISCMETLPVAMRAIRSRLRSQTGRQLSVPQFRTMMRLQNGAKTNKQLADEIGLSVAAMSRLIQQLAVLHLVTRKTDDADRREVWLTLTAKGAAQMKKSTAQVSEQLAVKLKDLSLQDKKNLKEGLRIILSTMC
jgi:DNA-binding MarR family transcriptional regulator